MTQEEKNLLLKDLFARLPYNVIVHRTYIWGGELKEDDGELEVFDMDSFLNESVEKLNKQGCTIKPYLRPLFSMTEEEKKELSNYDNAVQRTDFFYSHHIDCRFMVEKGLALKAPKGMYDLK